MKKENYNSCFNGLPENGGLYNSQYEHDACGVGFVVDIHGNKNHSIVENGLKVLENMSHRGAEGADSKSGDGAGILTQIPHEFILLHGIPVPERGKYGTGLIFMPKEIEVQQQLLEIIRQISAREGLTLMHVRDVPVDSSVIGEVAKSTEPAIKQLFIIGDSGDSLERKLYVIRKRFEKECLNLFKSSRYCYVVSLSSKRIVYKGMLTSLQLREYFIDLSDPYYTSAIALVHSRFSTNTFPTWDLAQPFRLLGHNGEINTISGNRAWLSASEVLLNNGKLGDISDITPIIQPDMSDSASVDNALEFFTMSGLSLPHTLSMMVPESFNETNPISAELRAFYDFHSIFMFPWDGPATLLFSDGRYVGGMLDRNGLRPARYLLTKSGMMVVASETGVLDIDPSEIELKGRFRAGKMLIIDTEAETLKYDVDVKQALSDQHPYLKWLEENRVTLSNVTSGRKVTNTIDNYEHLLKVFRYSKEDIETLMLPMINNGNEPIGSMGNDTPIPVLSTRPYSMFDYFKQHFAQVTNPPIDPIREKTVMSLSGHIGAARGNFFEPSSNHCKVVRLEQPILTNRDIDILNHIDYKGFHTISLSMLFKVSEGVEGMEQRLKELCSEAEKAVDDGKNYIILSDRGVTKDLAPIPSLLALSSIHHYLINKHKRQQTAVIVESAEPREIMHMALLIGFGASAVCPYMAFAVIDNLVSNHAVQLDYPTAQSHYLEALNKGLLKIISKSGISTIRSYSGSQLFESIGLSQSMLDKYFMGINSPVGGVGVEKFVRETLEALESAFSDNNETSSIEDRGVYLYKKGGESHAWSPKAVAALRQAVRDGGEERYKEFAEISNNPEHPIFLRNLMSIKENPIDIDKVEPVESIVKRFTTGAISLGAISPEAHETLAIAMNRIGGKSNTGEGGEDPARYKKLQNGDSLRSAVKQVASGRFGVDAEYLVNADEIQIKVAQGAKPGEGGQLPGYKVNELVAKTRHSIPGITLISPPPHHDIYSIEDLSQLIFDLRNVNPEARISVKLVSSSGVGTIAAGVAKAKADMIVISGGDGGTGASPLSSTMHAGMPFEIGIAEAQQTLLLNNLRGKVVLQVDGQLKTGYDVIISALLGAEEFGFSTAPLISIGCVMDRKCHSNTCPVGIATQNPELRKKFTGTPEQVIRYFEFVAEEVRGYLAKLGFTKLEDIVGRTDLIELVKEAPIDLSKLLWRPENYGKSLRHEGERVNSKALLENTIDTKLLKKVVGAIDYGMPVFLEESIRNTNRSVGAMLSGIIAKRYGNAGLKDDTINIQFNGSAGQSFGAFLAHGITLTLVGDANDYVGKGLSGGKIAVRPPKDITYNPEDSCIAGNTLLYGATAGELYINGTVGERFAVRNSGAVAVVEGVSDHCCEYMTGGRVVVLGAVGRNFAAGMSGGIAYVWNYDGKFDFFCNMEMVEIAVPNEDDSKEIKHLISSHYRHTDSPLAKRMLDNWDEYSKHFLKVLPIEYKKILDSEKTIK